MKTEIEFFEEMSAMARIGWWSADLRTGEISCSAYVRSLFPVCDNNIITLRDVFNAVRADYRDDLTKWNFAERDYEWVFPIIASGGEKWLRARCVGDSENKEELHGYVQEVPASECVEIDDHHNAILHRLDSITETLSNFVKERSEEKAVKKILHDVLVNYEVDRAFIVEYNDDYTKCSCLHEVVCDGVESFKQSVQDRDTCDLNWWTAKIKNREPIIFSNVANLPAEALGERNMMREGNVKSILCVPLVNAQRVIGYMGIDSTGKYRNWTDRDYQWLLSLSNEICVFLELQRNRNHAIKEQELMHKLLNYMPIGYAQVSIVTDAQGRVSDYQMINYNRFLQDNIHENYVVTPKGGLGTEVHSPEFVADKISWYGKVVEQGYMEEDIYLDFSDKYVHKISYYVKPEQIIDLYVDITNLQRVRLSLERSSEMFVGVFENAPAAVLIYDKKGKLVRINNKAMEIFGVSKAEDMLGVNLFDDPNFPEDAKKEFERNAKVDFRVSYNYAKAKKVYATNKVMPANLQCHLTKVKGGEGIYDGLIFVASEDFDKMDAMDKVRDLENVFSLISNYARVGYAKFNTLNQNGYAIAQWLVNLGEHPDTPIKDVVGVYSKMHPDDRAEILDFYKKLVTGEKLRYKADVRVKDDSAAGSWKWARVNLLTTKYAPDEGVIEVVGMNVDITEMKETEAALIAARNKAESMDKLKTAFLANMSHEIRTPLNAIIGFSELLVATEDKSEREKYVDILHSNSELLLQLISDILDLSKIESGSFDYFFTEVDVEALCDEVRGVMSIKATPGVDIINESRGKSCVIIGDRNRIKQVLVNMIGNAIKFTNKGSINFGFDLPDAGKIRFYVRDTGVGIDPAQTARIFERFVKLNNFVSGTGLGLSICKSLVTQMGGEIGVESALGVGSTFWFVIPTEQQIQ